MQFINLQAQYQKYKEEIDFKIQNSLNTSSFIGGYELEVLNKNLANFCNVKHAYGCSNGTDALLIALKALDIKAGDEIITTPFSFIATSEMISFLGAKPVFVDIDENDYNIDISQVEKAITEKTKAVLAVSIFGQMPNLLELKKICDANNLYLIEDAAQSYGAKDSFSNYSCSIAHISTTSFFPSKPLGCYGDGGGLFTNDENLANTINLLINHGSTKRYMHEIIGLNARLDTIQAAVLNVKLKYFQDEINTRQILAKRYNQNLKNCITPKIKDGYLSVYAQYSVRVENKDKIIEKLSKNGIPTAVHYPIPLHLQPCFQYLGYKKGDFKICEKVCDEILSLPFSAFLTEEEQERVIEAFNA